MQTMTRITGFLLLAAMLLISLPALARNTVNDGELPPRPTLTPTPIAQSTVASGRTSAAIILVSDGDTAGLETAVEWQDEYDNWHTVESWQSPFNEYKQVIWAVAANDFGKGPFRWVVAQGEMTIVVSSDFYLPLSASEAVTRHVMP